MGEGSNIRQKLLQIQSRLKAPKNQRNTFGNYNYRSCEDILEGLKPLLGEVMATLAISDTIELIGERYYIKATARLMDVTTGECVEVSALAREEENKKGMDASQITGSASSYARKYALNGMFCIDDTKDADATNDHEKGQQKQKQEKATPFTKAAPPTPAPAPRVAAAPSPAASQTRSSGNSNPASEPQRKKLYAMIKDLAWTPDEAKGFIEAETGKGSSKDLTMDEIQVIFEKLQGLIDAREQAQWDELDNLETSSPAV